MFIPFSHRNLLNFRTFFSIDFRIVFSSIFHEKWLHFGGHFGDFLVTFFGHRSWIEFWLHYYPILVALWLPLGSLWLPLGSLLAPFGSLWAPIGSLWAPFGFLLAPFWCPWAHFRLPWSSIFLFLGSPCVFSCIFSYFLWKSCAKWHFCEIVY